MSVFDIDVDSTTEGFSISVSGFDPTFDDYNQKVLLTVTDNENAGENKHGAFTFTKLRKNNEAKIDFVVDSSLIGNTYLIIADVRLVNTDTIGGTEYYANHKIDAKSTHATLGGIPNLVGLVLPGAASIDGAISYNFTDLTTENATASGVKYVQFVVSNKTDAAAIDFSATMNVADVFGNTITINGSNNDLSDDMVIDNCTEYEVAVIFSNDVGAAAITTTELVTPSSKPNIPTIVELKTGYLLTNLADMDGKIDIIFVKGTQIEHMLDISYTVKVTDDQDNIFTRVFDVDDIQGPYPDSSFKISLTSNDINFQNITDPATGAGWTLTNGNEYKIQIQATNVISPTEYGISGYTDIMVLPSAATPSGLLPSYTLVSDAVDDDPLKIEVKSNGTGGITATFNGNLQTVAENNGSEITEIQLCVRDNNGINVAKDTLNGEPLADAISAWPSEPIALTFQSDVGAEQSITVFIKNGNETKINIPVISVASTGLPAAIDTNSGTALPWVNTKSLLNSNEISLGWSSSGPSGWTPVEVWGGFNPPAITDPPSGSKWIVRIYEAADYVDDSNVITTPPIDDVPLHEEAVYVNSFTLTNDKFENGKALIATITPVNGVGPGLRTTIQEVFAASRQPSSSFSNSTSGGLGGAVVDRRTFLNSLVSRTFIKEYPISLKLPGINSTSTNKFVHDLTDKAVNGGYDITQVQFQVRSIHHDGNVSKVLKSGKIDLYDSSGDLQDDLNSTSALDIFDNDALLEDTTWYQADGSKELILEMYYLNSVYNDIRQYTLDPNYSATPPADFTTKIIVSNTLVTTVLAHPDGFTMIDNSTAVIKFKRVQDVAANQLGPSQATTHTIKLLAQRPELANGSGIIAYVAYPDGNVTETITDAAYSAGIVNGFYTDTFVLTSGYKYTPEIVTTSKEQNVLLLSTDDNYQPHLTSEYTATLDDTDDYTGMPYGDPEIVPIVNPANIDAVIGFIVRANGSSLQDAILITSRDDISDLTEDLINSALDVTKNDGIIYEEGGAATAPPFKSYYDISKQETINFNYRVDNVVPNGQFFFLVSSIKGHYVVSTSNNSFYAIFAPATPAT